MTQERRQRREYEAARSVQAYNSSHWGRQSRCHESRHPRFQEKREKVSRISGVRREYDERLAVG